MPRRRHPLFMNKQRGAAALVVVMLLFFVISLTAAYTSRNLIFEQRTATNQYRSTQALEAADAGLEWVITQLNSGLVTDSCTPSTDATAGVAPAFRQRYLTVNAISGALTPVVASGGGSIEPRCVFDGSSSSSGDWNWSCSCPKANAPSASLSAPSGGGPAPAFIAELQRPPSLAARPDLLQLEVNSCTRLSNDCINFNAVRGGTGDGVSAVRSFVALRGALTKVPAGALTVSGVLAPLPAGATLAVRNQDVAANGVTIHTYANAASMPASGLALSGLAGAAPSSTMVTGDDTLVPVAKPGFSSEDRRFAAFFGMLPATYKQQPGLPVINCAGGCDAAAINTAMLRNPGRPVWLESSAGTVSIDANVGTAALPALLIVDGNLALSSGVTVHGLIYARKVGGTTLTVNGSATLRGAAVAEGDLTLAGAGSTTNVIYDAAVLRALRVSYGTFVRVPGSWRDF